MIELLPDGSTAEVEPIRGTVASSLISRFLPDGTCVWGQAFGMPSAIEHDAQVERVLSRMRSTPAAYRRPR